MRTPRPSLVLFAGLLALTLVGLVPTTAEASIFDDANRTFGEALRSGNYALAFAMIYVVGLGTAFTPCVYPMITITVSVFGARETKNKAESAALSTSFVAGLVSLFVPLGVVSALTGSVFGAWLGNPIVAAAFALLFTAMAASMFGAFELNLPPALQNRLADVGGIGHRGAFALGFVSALIAAPCTGPALIALLSWISTTGNIALGAAGMFFYSVGLGTLFWVVGTFAVALPKSGRWMEAVKSVFGIALLVMALYYVRPFIPGLLEFVIEHRFPLQVAAVCALMLSVGLGAIHLDFHEPDTRVRVRKALGVTLATLGSFAIVMTLLAPSGRLAWREDFAAAVAEARASGQPYIVDFGASWCGACGELDRNTFAHPDVGVEGGRFIAVHVDLSPGHDSPDRRQFLASYGQRSLPLVVLHGSDGREVHRVTEFVEPEPFLELMRSVN